jgi:hypothetical protein
MPSNYDDPAALTTTRKSPITTPLPSGYRQQQQQL